MNVKNLKVGDMVALSYFLLGEIKEIGKKEITILTNTQEGKILKFLIKSDGTVPQIKEKIGTNLGSF